MAPVTPIDDFETFARSTDAGTPVALDAGRDATVTTGTYERVGEVVVEVTSGDAAGGVVISDTGDSPFSVGSTGFTHSSGAYGRIIPDAQGGFTATVDNLGSASRDAVFSDILQALDFESDVPGDYSVAVGVNDYVNLEQIDQRMLDVTVTAPAPEIANLDGDSVLAAGGERVAVDTGAEMSVPEASNFGSGSVVVARDGPAGAGEFVLDQDGTGLSLDPDTGELSYGGIVMGQLDPENAGQDGGPGNDLAFGLSGASAEAVQATIRALRFESATSGDYTITTELVDGSDQRETATSTVTVDAEAPIIDTTAVPIEVGENASGGTRIATPAAFGETGDVAWALGAASANAFEIDSATGAVTLAPDAALDHETQPELDLEILATDAAGNTASQLRKVAVADVNEAPAVAGGGDAQGLVKGGVRVAVDRDGDFTVADPDAAGLAGGTVTVSRAGPAGQGEFFIDQDGTDLALDPDTGQLSYRGTVMGAVDRQANGGPGDDLTIALNGDATAEAVQAGIRALRFESDASGAYTIDVAVADAGGKTATTGQFRIDIDAQGPGIDFSGDDTAFAESAGTGASALVFTAPDDIASPADVSAELTGANAERFEIVENSDSGWSVLVADGARFDHETEPAVDITVKATDAAGNSATKTATVDVTDINEAPAVAGGGDASLFAGGMRYGIDDNGDVFVEKDRVRIDANGDFTVSDEDAGGLANGTLTVTRSGPAETGEFFIDQDGTGLVLDPDTGALSYNGTVMGSVDRQKSGGPGDDLAISLNGAATAEAVQAGIRALQFGSAESGAYSIGVTVEDAGGLQAAAASFAVTVDSKSPEAEGLQTYDLSEDAAAGTPVMEFGLKDNVSAPEDIALAVIGEDAEKFEIGTSNGRRAIVLAEDAPFDFEGDSYFEVGLNATDEVGNEYGYIRGSYVTDIDETPVLTGLDGDFPAVETGRAVAIDAGTAAGLVDPEGDFAGGTLTIARDQADGGTFFSNTHPDIEYRGLDLYYQGTKMGRARDGETGQPSEDLVIDLNASATPAAIAAGIRATRYQAAEAGTHGFTLAVADAGGNTVSADFSVDVGAAPVIAGIDGDSTVANEGSDTRLDSRTPLIEIADADSDIGGGTVTLARTGADTGVLRLFEGRQFGVDGAEITRAGKTVGTIDAARDGSAGTDMVIHLAAGATAEDVAEMLGAMDYAPQAAGTHGFEITVADAKGYTSAAATAEVVYNAAPSIAVPDGVAGDIGKGISLAGVAVGDDRGAGLRVEVKVDQGTISAQPAATADIKQFSPGRLFVISAATDATQAKADINATLDTLALTGAAHGTRQVTVKVTDSNYAETARAFDVEAFAAPDLGGFGRDPVAPDAIGLPTIDRLGFSLSERAITVADADSADLDGGRLTIARKSAMPGDLLREQAKRGDDLDAAAFAAGDTVSVGGSAIGTVAADADGRGRNDLVIELGSEATPAKVETLLNAMTYTTDAAGAHAFEVTLADGDGYASDARSFAVQGPTLADSTVHLEVAPAAGVFDAFGAPAEARIDGVGTNAFSYTTDAETPPADSGRGTVFLRPTAESFDITKTATLDQAGQTATASTVSGSVAPDDLSRIDRFGGSQTATVGTTLRLDTGMPVSVALAQTRPGDELVEIARDGDLEGDFALTGGFRAGGDTALAAGEALTRQTGAGTETLGTVIRDGQGTHDLLLDLDDHGVSAAGAADLLGALAYTPSQAGDHSFTARVSGGESVSELFVSPILSPGTELTVAAEAPEPDPEPEPGSAGPTPGDDRLAGGSGSDAVDLLDGDDSYAAQSGADTVRGGRGNDTVRAGSGTDTVFGGAGDDALHGGSGADRLWGGEGADIVRGGAGADRLGGGAGADTLTGGAGGDLVYGGQGGDDIDAGSGADTVWAGGGDDTVEGGSGDDRIWASGADGATAMFFAGAGADRLGGGGGGGGGGNSADGDADTVFGAGGNDAIGGGRGADALYGGAGDDILYGGDGADRLYSGTGADTIFGGAGADTVQASGSDTVTVLAGGGADTVRGGAGDDVLHGQGGDDTLRGGAGSDTITGNRGDDGLAGGGGADVVAGGAGADKLFGGAASDTLFGGTGADTLKGQAGSDMLIAGEGDDILIGQGGGDTLRAGAGDDAAYGGRGADAVDGGVGEDILHGQQGADRLRGGRGDDTVAGNRGDDVLSGNRGQDLLAGGQGSDFLDGGRGADTLFGGQGADRFYHAGRPGHGADWIRDFAEADTLLFGARDADADDFAVAFATTPGRGADGIEEAFVAHGGEILWAVQDGAELDALTLRTGDGDQFDLMA